MQVKVPPKVKKIWFPVSVNVVFLTRACLEVKVIHYSSDGQMYFTSIYSE